MAKRAQRFLKRAGFYHSIMESCVCQRFEFNDLKEARKILAEFRNFYNFERYGAPQLLDRISVFLCLLDDA